MPRYHVRFLKGPNMTLRRYFDAIEEGESFEEVLRRHTDWPIQVAWDLRAATAWNPGTCMYYQEMWEAAILKEGAHMPLIGAWQQNADDPAGSGKPEVYAGWRKPD